MSPKPISESARPEMTVDQLYTWVRYNGVPNGGDCSRCRCARGSMCCLHGLRLPSKPWCCPSYSEHE